jgi:hypothetical protein
MRPRYLTIGGITRSISDWALQPGAAHHSTISWRLKFFGWPAERAVFEPSQRPRKTDTYSVRLGGTAQNRRAKRVLPSPPMAREAAPFVPCVGSVRSYPIEALALLRRVS